MKLDSNLFYCNLLSHDRVLVHKRLQFRLIFIHDGHCNLNDLYGHVNGHVYDHDDHDYARLCFIHYDDCDCDHDRDCIFASFYDHDYAHLYDHGCDFDDLICRHFYHHVYDHVFYHGCDYDHDCVLILHDRVSSYDHHEDLNVELS